MPAYKYKAFISYSWADKSWGQWLHHALETYRTPSALIGRVTRLGAAPARLHPIFKDREEEAAGASIKQSIETALAESEFLIVICSPRAVQSKWVNREIAWFKTHRESEKILALIVDGEPLASMTPGRDAEECFPRTLLYKVDERLSPIAQAEDAPLAADARDIGDGKRVAKLKLAAAMLGLRLDEVVRRDNRRRAQRRRLVTAGLVALTTVLSGLTIFAFNQRDAAILARNSAVTAQRAAEAAEADAKLQRDDAQSLVEFMLTDFRKELDSLGRLDVLERTGERLLESFANQDLAKLDANALGRRARVLLLLGEVDNTRGNLDAALSRYKEAAAATEELLKRNPGSAQQIFDHAQSVFWVGYIAWQRGDADEAKKHFTRYHDYAQQLVAIDPNNDDWQMEGKYALNNLGTLAMDEGEAAEAEGYFRKSLEIATRLVERQPDNIERVIAAGQSYSWLADALYRQGRLSDARDVRSAETRLYDLSLKSQPKHASLIDSVIVAKFALSQIELASNRREAALTLAIEATRRVDELLAHEPDRAESLDRATFAYAFLGEAYFYNNLLAEARRSLTEAVVMGERLVVTNDNVVRWRGKTLSQPKLVLARLAGAEQKGVEALRQYHQVALNLEELIDAGVSDPFAIQRYCAALAGRARLSKKFEADWAKIVSILAPAQKKYGPEALVLLAEAFARTGKRDDALPIVSKLYDAGYRHPDFLAMIDAFPELKPAREAVAAAN